jgi:hypothetical protein
MAEAQSHRGSNWSEEEVARIIGDYFVMLQEEMFGKSYSKTEHRRKLQPLLNDRSDGSIEFKHQNISAVLVHLNYPYIEGYKPRGNYQTLLVQGVEKHLVRHPEFFDRLADSPIVSPKKLPDIEIQSTLDLFDAPPEKIEIPQSTQPWISKIGQRIDFARRDARNRQLGELGEQFVVELEKHRLNEQGRDDLANRIEWISHTRGDGIGFDVLSFNERDDSERFIEVKTTGLGKFFPFYVSSTEVRCSQDCVDQYHLYRVFRFSKSPRAYILSGSLSETCLLQPTQYRAFVQQGSPDCKGRSKTVARAEQ